MFNKLTNKDLEEISRLYSLGYGTIEIGKKYNTSASVINRVLRLNRTNIFPPGRRIRFTNEELERLIYLYVVEKLTAEEVGEALDVSRNTVVRILKKNHINIRKSEPLKNEIIDQIIELFNIGSTIQDISIQLALNTDKVIVILTREANPPLPVRRIVEMHQNQGMYPDQISESLNLNNDDIKLILDDYYRFVYK